MQRCSSRAVDSAQKDRWLMERARTTVLSSLRLIACAAVMMNLLSPTASFAASCEPPIAKAMAVEGKVDVRTTDSTQWRPVKLNDTFCPGDVIRVQERSRADIALSNQPMLRLDQNTTMTLGGIKKEGGSLIELTQRGHAFLQPSARAIWKSVPRSSMQASEGTEGVVRGRRREG